MNKNVQERSLYTEREQGEDLLESIYLLQQKGCPLTKKNICDELNMSAREYRRLCVQLVQESYLDVDFIEDTVSMTVRGNVRAQELLKKHNYLTDFLQLICKVEKDVAEDNACRLEHVISPDVFGGIIEYMRYGKDADRVVEGWDINRFYDPGIYHFSAGIYLPEKRYPRMLSREHYQMMGSIVAEVCEQSIFRIHILDAEGLWYLEEHVWKQAEQNNDGFAVPTSIFRYTISDQEVVTEGDAYIAFGAEPPRDQDIRELDVHLW